MASTSTPNGSETAPGRGHVEALAGLRIAVTGGRGLIGGRLLNRLAALGLQPVSLLGDVRQASAFAAPFDVLFHLAGAVPADFRRDSGAARQSNVQGAANAVEACIRHGARLVFVSTSGVYDLPADGPLSETAPLAPISEYAESKLAGENICREAISQLPRGAAVLRLFNPYGFGQSEDLLIGYIVRTAMAGKTVTIRTPGAERDFVHVSDVVTALVQCGAETDTLEIFNIGSGNACTVRNVTKKIYGRLPGDASPDFENGVDPHGRVIADIDCARRVLGWMPMVTLDRGIDEAVGRIPVIG